MELVGETEKTKLVLLNGIPGIGKTTIATEVYSKLSKKGLTASYVEEFVKNFANRKYPLLPEDQIFIFGGQTYNINTSLLANYKYVISCSSPMLCSFYANYYGKDRYLGLVDICHNWLSVISEKYDVYNYFMLATEEEIEIKYKSIGRFEDKKDMFKFQSDMLDFFGKKFPIMEKWIGLDSDTIINNLGVKL